jgi:hypothetical protein
MAYRWRTPAEIAAAGGTKRWSAFALSAVAGYPTVDHVEDGEFYGTTGTEFEGELVVAPGAGGALIPPAMNGGINA